MTQIEVGHCGKCGAPYFMDGYNMSILPPTPRPTCVCWNTPKTSTSTGTNTRIDTQFRAENEA